MPLKSLFINIQKKGIKEISKTNKKNSIFINSNGASVKKSKRLKKR